MSEAPAEDSLPMCQHLEVCVQRHVRSSHVTSGSETNRECCSLTFCFNRSTSPFTASFKREQISMFTIVKFNVIIFVISLSKKYFTDYIQPWALLRKINGFETIEKAAGIRAAEQASFCLLVLSPLNHHFPWAKTGNYSSLRSGKKRSDPN